MSRAGHNILCQTPRNFTWTDPEKTGDPGASHRGLGCSGLLDGLNQKNCAARCRLGLMPDCACSSDCLPGFRVFCVLDSLLRVRSWVCSESAWSRGSWCAVTVSWCVTSSPSPPGPANSIRRGVENGVLHPGGDALWRDCGGAVAAPGGAAAQSTQEGHSWLIENKS